MSYKECVRPCLVPAGENKYGNPLHRACRLGYKECVNILLKHKHIDTSVLKDQLEATTLKSKYTPLHLAALKGHTDAINLLYESSLVVGEFLFKDLLKWRTKSDNAPIHVAIKGGNLQ